MTHNKQFDVKKAKHLYILTTLTYAVLYTYLWLIHIPIIEKYFHLNENIIISLKHIILLHAFVILSPYLNKSARRHMFSFPIFRCTNCHKKIRFVHGFTRTKPLEILLWLLFIIPGFCFHLYLIVRRYKCKQCKKGFFYQKGYEEIVKSMPKEQLAATTIPMLVLTATALVARYNLTGETFDKSFLLLTLWTIALLLFLAFRTTSYNKKCINCGFTGNPVTIKTDKLSLFVWGITLLSMSPYMVWIAILYSFYKNLSEKYFCPECKEQISPPS